MIRVGIIGTENSHALHFAKTINLGLNDDQSALYPDIEVVACYGPDEESARLLVEEAAVKQRLESPGDFLERVDAMMITSRKGSVHLAYAKPFIEAGIPLFIDKPVTSDPAEAQELIRLAIQNKVLLAGGSGCKYAEDVQSLKQLREEWSEAGEFLSASINFSADENSIYDGFYFYAPHLTEMALTIFGYDPRSVQASSGPGGITAILSYDRYDVSLHYTKGSQSSSCVFYGTRDNYCRKIDIGGIYGEEVEHFARMLREKQMPQSYEELVCHVTVIDAILEASRSGSVVSLDSHLRK